MNTPLKVVVGRDYELDPTGVTTVWYWMCLNKPCRDSEHTGYGHALFWENALMMANKHYVRHLQDD